jgi:hypothetical protein
MGPVYDKQGTCVSPRRAIASEQQCETKVESGVRSRIFILLPCDPAQVWGKKSRHYARGTLNGMPFQGSLGARQGIYVMSLNKDLREQAGVVSGVAVCVVMAPDEAQAEDVPEDLAARLTLHVSSTHSAPSTATPISCGSKRQKL